MHLYQSLLIPSLDRSREEKIQKIKNREIEQVVDELKKKDFYDDEVLFKNAVTAALENRKKQAAEYVTNFFKRPRIIYQGESGLENTNFIVAKRILHLCKEESIKHLRQIYKDADSTTKGNIIEVLGTMPDSSGGVIVKLLVRGIGRQNHI